MKENDITEIPVPLAIRQLTELHNARIKEYQQTALTEIQKASVELMGLMGLTFEDGWRLDLDNLKFVKVSAEELPIDGTA